MNDTNNKYTNLNGHYSKPQFHWTEPEKTITILTEAFRVEVKTKTVFDLKPFEGYTVFFDYETDDQDYIRSCYVVAHIAKKEENPQYEAQHAVWEKSRQQHLKDLKAWELWKEAQDNHRKKQLEEAERQQVRKLLAKYPDEAKQFNLK